jgi:hypothetical protein
VFGVKGLSMSKLFIPVAAALFFGLNLTPLPVEAVSGSMYYVSPSGNDLDPGTEALPWRTIQKAADSLKAGDSVTVLAGQYDERVQITLSGISGSPITYRTQGTVTMKGFTVKADYIVIQGFDITDTEDDWSEGQGIFVEGSHCLLEDNYIYFATRGGIVLFDDGGSDPVSDCVVRNNRLYRNAMAGVSVQGRNHLIEGNEIWGTIQYHPKWADPPGWVDADGMRFFGSGHTIRRNYIHDITTADPENIDPHIDCFQTWSDSNHESASYVVFEQNICQLLEPEDVFDVGHGFMLESASDLIIRNNIIQAFGGVNTGGGGNSDLTIVNNIFANDLKDENHPGGIGLQDCPNTVVKNNIFYDQPSRTILVTGNSSGQEIDYNLAYRSDGQASNCYSIDYVCVDPRPIHDLWDVDPLFVDPAAGDFHLLQDSPAIDVGVSLTEVTNDFDGTIRPQGNGYDIGPYEFGSAPTFIDVPMDHWAHDYIEALYQGGYVAGCSTNPLMYCPEQTMTRAESAVFVMRGVNGAGYTPQQPTSQIFDDVSLDEWFAKWATSLWDAGYTSGCGTEPLVYCPLEEHTRTEGTVFFLRMMYGAEYEPLAPEGIFIDVEVDYWGAKWIEAAYNAGLIPACETEPDLRFCPDDPLDRAMGAYMMVQAKQLPLP